MDGSNSSECDFVQDVYNGNMNINYPVGYRDNFDQKIAYLLVADLGWSISVLGACESFGVGPGASNDSMVPA